MGNLAIFPLISQSDIISNKEPTLTLKSMSVWRQTHHGVIDNVSFECLDIHYHKTIRFTVIPAFMSWPSPLLLFHIYHTLTITIAPSLIGTMNSFKFLRYNFRDAREKFVFSWIHCYRQYPHTHIYKYIHEIYNLVYSVLQFNVPFHNIFQLYSLKWQSVLMVEETRVPGENH
jgi:hypothetical protein